MLCFVQLQQILATHFTWFKEQLTALKRGKFIKRDHNELNNYRYVFHF